MKTGLLVLAACGLATSLPAAAADNPFAKDEAVLRLNGLDLSTAEGQQRLAIRMDQAARAVCGDRLSSVHLAMEAHARECRAAVLADIGAASAARTAAAAEAGHIKLASSR